MGEKALFAYACALFIVATMCYIIVVDIAPCCAILCMSAEKLINRIGA